jgi:hypothetical protein
VVLAQILSTVEDGRAEMAPWSTPSAEASHVPQKGVAFEQFVIEVLNSAAANLQSAPARIVRRRWRAASDCPRLVSNYRMRVTSSTCFT